MSSPYEISWQPIVGRQIGGNPISGLPSVPPYTGPCAGMWSPTPRESSDTLFGALGALYTDTFRALFSPIMGPDVQGQLPPVSMPLLMIPLRQGSRMLAWIYRDPHYLGPQ